MVWTRSQRARWRCAASTASLLLAAAFAQAQMLPGPPPEASSGVLTDQLRRTIPIPSSEGRVPAPPAAQPLARPAEADNIQFVLQDVRVSGAGVIPQAEMAPLWQEMKGKRVSLAAVYALADELTAMYRNRGYILSAVTVPVQEVKEDGAVVELTAIEGYVGSVRFDDGVAATARMQAEAAVLTTQRPLTSATLERQMLLLNELGGLTAQAYFEPGSTTGEAKLTIKAVRRTVSGFVGVQNRVSRLLGRAVLEGRVTLHNMLGWDESHSLLLQTSDRGRLRSLGYYYNQPLGSDGLALSLFLGHVESYVDSARTPIRSASDIATIGLSYPLVRSRAQTLRLRARLNVYNGTQEFTEFLFLQRDRARALRVGAAWDRTDGSGVTFADAELSKGLSGMGATRSWADDAIRSGADYGFTKFNYFAGRLQHLGGDFSLQASLQGQWTRDRLPPSERFALGGDLILRAFNAGELIGDRGYAGKLELRYEPPLIPGGRVSFYAFAEAGRVRTIEAQVASTSAKGGTTGLGARATLASGLNMYAEVAKPHWRNVAYNNSRRARVFAGLSYDF